MTTFVQSKLNDDVRYEESREPETSYSSIFFISLDQENSHKFLFPIVYGDERKRLNLTFFHVYIQLQSDKKVQIGVYEFVSKKLINYMKGKHLNIKQSLFPKPLLYPFVTDKYLSNLKNKTYKLRKQKHINHVVEENDGEEHDGEVEESKELVKVETKEKEKKVEEEESIVYDEEVFTRIEGQHITPEKEPEETEAIAKNIHSNYTHKKGEFWLQTLLKNNHYHKITSEGGGDCLFATIRDAFGSIGLQTTIQKLRRKVSSEVSNGLLEEYASKYDYYHHENILLGNKIKELEKKYETTQQIFQQTADFETKKKLLGLSKQIHEQRDNFIAKKKICVEIFKNYEFMKSVDTLEKLKKKMQSCQFWGNEWILTTLERILNIKFIVLDFESYTNQDIGSVFMPTTDELDPVLQKRKEFLPDYYILVERNRSKEYTLIGYKARLIFVYSDLPFDLKQWIRNKCAEHADDNNLGDGEGDTRCLFCYIKQFQHFYKQDKKFSRIISKKKELKLKDSFSDSSIRNLYDDATVFVIQEKGEKNHILPGKAFNEKIREEQIIQFYELLKYTNWRLKLHDSWVDITKPFELDGHFWNSVTHFMNANKFKKKNPEYYLFFTAESTTPLSKNPKLAIAAGSKSGLLKGKVIRPPEIKVEKYESYKKLLSEALFAKLNQHEEWKNILLATKRAKLTLKCPNGLYKLSNVLMMIRQKLQQKTNRKMYDDDD
jgi:predicted NAD-dependent protein-ADP-ribosyltransferase YbiA (DUF1768 family)